MAIRNNSQNNNGLLSKDIKVILREQSEKLKRYIEEKELFSLDDFIDYHSKSIDKFIIKIEKEDDLFFIAGNFHIKYFPKNKFGIIIDLYFKDKQGDWINKRSRLDDLDLNIYLNHDAINILKESNQLEYPIERPTED